MKANNALRKANVTQIELESLIVQRETYSSLRKRLEALEDAMKAAEVAIVSKLEMGAEIHGPYDVSIRTKESRHPHWKAHFAEIAGAVAAEDVLRNTVPTLTKILVVK